MGMKQIRRMWGVPAKRGGRVRYTGGGFHGIHGPRMGTIRSVKNGYLMIQLDGDAWTKPFHPTWALEYLDKTKSGGSHV